MYRLARSGGEGAADHLPLAGLVRHPISKLKIVGIDTHLVYFVLF
jgi:hypothetical protein